MKSRFLVLAVAFVLVVWAGSAWASRTPFVATPDPACAFPDMLATEELYERAGKEYDILLEATPSLQCAQEGLVNSSVALIPSPTPEPTATPDTMTVVKKLEDEGYTDEANKLLVEEIQRNPTVTTSDELNSLDDDPWNDGPLRWLAALALLITDNLSTWLTLLAIGIIVYTIVERRVSRPALDIATLSSDIDDVKLTQSLTESIQAAYQETKDGRQGGSVKLIAEAQPAETTNVTANLLSAQGGILNAVYNWTTKLWERTYVLQGTTVIDPKRGAGLVLSLKNGNSIEATQTIWFLTQFDTPTSSSDDGNPTADDFLALSEAAGIWLFSEMCRMYPSYDKSQQPFARGLKASLLRARKAEMEEPLKEVTTEPSTASIAKTSSAVSNGLGNKPMVGAAVSAATQRAYHDTWSDWQSYAFFRNSRTILSWKDESAAIALLHKSLNRDPGFVPALMNLFTLELQSEIIRLRPTNTTTPAEQADSGNDNKATGLPPGSYLDAARTYAALLGTVWESTATAKVKSVVRAKTLFNYLAANDYTAPWTLFPPLLTDLQSQALSDAIREAEFSKDVMHRQMSVPLQQLQAILDYRRNSENRHERQNSYELAQSAPEWVSRAFGAQNQYGLACFCAAVVHSEEQKESRDKWARRALDHLSRAIQLSGGLRKWAPHDPSLIPLVPEYKAEFAKLLEVLPKEEKEEASPIEQISWFGRVARAVKRLFTSDEATIATKH